MSLYYMCLDWSNAELDGDCAGFHLTLHWQRAAVKNSYKLNTQVSSYLPHTNNHQYVLLKYMQHLCEDKYIL